MDQQIDQLQDYREFLRRELEERCHRNPKYSLRSFARDLGIAPSRLSDVLRGRYGLSREAAEQIAGKLGLSPAETQMFCDLVESQHSRDRHRKKAARNRVEARETPYHQMTMDAFHIIADWYHYAILELVSIENFKPDLGWMARRLGLSTITVKSALERLERLELIRFDRGTWKTTEDFTASPTDVPSAAIKKFHQQILEKALSSITLQSVHERDLSSVVMAIDQKDLPAAKEHIKTFRRSFDVLFGKASSKNAIYCLSTQFFRIDQKES